MKRNYYFATWLRAFSAILILLCHYVGETSNLYIQYTGEIFVIGVDVFLILSGFLFGTQHNKFDGDIWSWYKKRLKRIYVPFEIFLAFLLVVYLIIGKPIVPVNCLFVVAGMRGFGGGLNGADHTWFVTAILLCYLATPLIAKLGRLLCKQINKKVISIFAAGGGIAPILLALIPNEVAFTLGAPIITYSFAYFLGVNFEKVKKANKNLLLSLGIIPTLFCVRLILRHFLDGTIWYDRVTTYYTMVPSAFCLFYIFACLFDKTPPKLVNWFSKVSFEVYLYHYMFCVGPLRLFGLTPSWTVDCLLVTAVTVALAGVMNKAAELVINRHNSSRISKRIMNR